MTAIMRRRCPPAIGQLASGQLNLLHIIFIAPRTLNAIFLAKQRLARGPRVMLEAVA
jgi:hypothetical protein